MKYTIDDSSDESFSAMKNCKILIPWRSRQWKRTSIGFFTSRPHDLEIDNGGIKYRLPYLNSPPLLRVQSFLDEEEMNTDTHPEVQHYYRVGRFYAM